MIYNDDFELLDLSEDQIEQLIYDLVGTTLNLDLYLEAEFNIQGVDWLAVETLEDIDAAMFLCDVCGWWCDDNDRSENDYIDVCDDCAEEQHL